MRHTCCPVFSSPHKHSGDENTHLHLKHNDVINPQEVTSSVEAGTGDAAGPPVFTPSSLQEPTGQLTCQQAISRRRGGARRQRTEVSSDEAEDLLQPAGLLQEDIHLFISM